ncbi:hypothetical protein RDWZM_006782 [Blomia tropicalis]|uniref:Uncharacterized protein n=1 Tax=Blomia tropicalis TaxID=40697 RepID=A0A9Q0MC29_BLOTA|nr:hypothetical protein RDWZM_006782 [Blomia tropicalis]
MLFNVALHRMVNLKHYQQQQKQRLKYNRKKKYSSPYHLSRKAGFEKSIRNFKLLKQLLGPPSSASVNSPTSTSYTILSPSLSLSSSLNNTSTILLQSSSSSSILSSSSTSSVNLGGNKHAMPIPRAARKQTPTVTHQFQQSLQQLMDTLSHANPFFVRCIKSNADKMPNHFDDRLVLMQLRYTGMLETVRIRQSGYSVRLTFDEFIQHYRILLPKGLLSSKMDVQQFLLSMKLQPDMYQIGKTKVFMRESEKLVLDERLHEEILRRIINLQRWVRTWLCRKRFSEMRNAAIVIQTYARRYIAQRRLSQLKKIAQYENWAANCIQKHWRCYQMRQWFTNLRRSVVNFQSHCRGYLLRTKLDDISEQNAKARDEIKQQQQQQQQQQTKSNVSVSIRSMPPAQPSSVSQRGSDDPEILIPEPVQFAQDFIANAFSNISSTTTPTSTTTAETVKTQSGTGRLCTTTITIHNSTVTNDDHDLEEDANPLESDLDDDDHFENDDHIHLNRKRNIPIRKTSFKRKANNKSLSDDKLLTTIANQHDQSSTGYGNSSSTNLHQTNQQQQHQSSSHGHRQLSKLASDTNVMLTSTSSLSAFGSSGYNTNSDSASSFQKLRIYDQVSNTDLGQQSSQQFQQQQQLRQPIHNRLQGKFSSSDQDQGTATSSSNVGAIQKAKATFKNMIGKSSSQEISKRSLKQSVSVKGSTEMDSEMYQQLQQQQQQQASQYSNQHFVPNKSLSNSDLGLPNVGSIESGSFNFYLYNNQQTQSINNNTSSHHNNQSHFSSYTSTSSTQKPRTLSQEGNFSLLSRHFIKKEEHFKSGEICAICENSMLSMAYQQQPQSHYKCSECRQLFHNKCIHLSSDIPCKGSSTSAPSGNSVLSALNPSRPPRNKQKKQKNFSKSYIPKENQESCSLLSHNIITHHNDSLSIDDQSNNSINSSTTKQSVRITQFTDPHDILITDKDELQIMDKFISKKIREIEEVKKKSKESMVDVVFKIALKEFKSNLYSTYSVANQEGYFTRLTYKDLIVHFEQILLNVCQKEKTYTSFPVIMGVNAFRGFMDELRKTHNRNELKAREDKMNGYNSKKSYKRKQSKKIRSRKKEDEVFTSYEHEFILSMANIYTVCEVCSSFMWLMDKIWVCRRCKLTCHKKCAEKVNHTCRDNSKSPNKLIFGSPLTKLISDECRIPWVVEQLITKIELKGLYTEGIYRKSGTSSKINELKQRFDEEIPDLDLDQYSIHVLAATLKLFFREMPEPLMTYELYDDFLWATTISDPTERVQIILNHISKLPRANYDLLERLTFHLARVAQQESANRMNANSLAIVFAPCVLRTNKMMQMQDKLNDISKQTICIESIISERMRQISDTLNDIDILDVACHTASSRLSSIRYSKLNPSRDSAGLIRTNSNVDDEEALLTQRINELITEKNHLTTILPTFRLASACSDEDMLSSNENDEQINANVGSSAEDGIAGGTVYRSSKTLTNRILVEHHNQSTPQASTSKNVVTSGSMKPRVTTQQKALHSTMADHSETLNLNDESMLQHPTKNRAHTPQRRRPPSRFGGGGGGGVDPKSFTGRSIHTDKDVSLNSNESQSKYSSSIDSENPVMV